jgi:beta-lactamase regulating signal transducer with metallopeptidase domain
MSSIVDLVGLTLLHFLWQGCLLGIGLWAALFCARRSDARVRYSMCCGALIALALCPIGTAIALRPTAVEAGPTSFRSGTNVVSNPVVPSLRPVIVEASPSRELGELLPTIVLVWGLGVTVLSVRLTGGLWVVERLRRLWSRPAPPEWQAKLDSLRSSLGISRQIRLMVSERVKVPIAMGVFRVVVIVPASLLMRFPSDQVECLLLHELAHVRRHDYLVNLIQSCIETLLFYHPVVWWVSHTLRAEREHCCDEIVIRSTGNSRLYARALTQLEHQLNQIPQLSMSARGGHLMNRVARILSTKQAQRRSTAVWPSLILLTALAIGLGETVHAQSSDPAKKQAVHKHRVSKHVTVTHSGTATRGRYPEIAWATPTFEAKVVRAKPATAVIVRMIGGLVSVTGKVNLVTDLKRKTGYVALSARPRDIVLRLDDVPFSDALKKLSEQIGFSFSIAPQELAQHFKYESVHVNLVHATLQQAIRAICYSANATYKVEDGTYYFGQRLAQGFPEVTYKTGDEGYSFGISPATPGPDTARAGSLGGGVGLTSPAEAPSGTLQRIFGRKGVGSLFAPAQSGMSQGAGSAARSISPAGGSDSFSGVMGSVSGPVARGNHNAAAWSIGPSLQPDGPRFHINYLGLSLESAAKYIATQYKKTIVVGPDLPAGPGLSFDGEGLTFEEALRGLCKLSGAKYRVKNGVVNIYYP